MFVNPSSQLQVVAMSGTGHFQKVATDHKKKLNRKEIAALKLQKQQEETALEAIVEAQSLVTPPPFDAMSHLCTEPDDQLPLTAQQNAVRG